MRRTHLTMQAGSRRGQALMVAVLLMMAILLVGILFVALVTYNQDQSTRHEDTLAAQAMAEAGIRYATYMLENSPEGADWRPPEPPLTDSTGADPLVYGPDTAAGTEDDYYTDMELARGWAPVVDNWTNPQQYQRRGFTRFPDPRHPSGVSGVTMANTVGGGYFFLRVTYNPWEPGNTDTPDPLNWHIKIESIGRVEGSQVYREMVAYKPVPMLNYARLVHNITDHGQPAELGVPAYADMDRDGFLLQSGARRPDWLATTINGPVKVNGALNVAGGMWWDGTGGTNVSNIEDAGTTFSLTSGFSADGFLRQDKIEASGGIYRWDEPADTVDDQHIRPAQVTIDGDPPQLLHYTSDDIDPDADSFDTMNGHVLDGQQQLTAGQSRFVDRTDVGSLTLGDGTTGFDRYTLLTRQSGEIVNDTTTGNYVNNGQWGFGKGIYINNTGDIQFEHDIQALIDDWQRPTLTGATPPMDSGWNALYTVYSPPAVEIEFLPTEAAAGSYEVSTNPLDVDAGEVWWPYHENGQPGIKITRHDRTWRIPEGANAGQDSGQRTIVLDYPTPWLDGTDDVQRYPVIVAEGNVRVSGQLPPALNEFGDPTRDGVTRRSYDMVVVSGGTVYIDGQLLSPSDHLGDTVLDAFNTKVALLARDCVCMNATQIVPQDTFGSAPAVPDDPLNPVDSEKHWELSPGADGRGYSLFYWGDDRVGSSAALVVQQTAADPGPSGVSLTLWDENAGYTAYDFVDRDPAVATLTPPMQDTTFALVPEGTAFPVGGALPYPTPPQGYGVAAVAPTWAPYRAWVDNDPSSTMVLPWDLLGRVDPTPGVKNALVLRHSDPHLGAGSTSYWLKHWKVAEYDADGNPVGAINARVNAAVFAERGCWYVLTPGYFDAEMTTTSVRNDDPTLTPDEARWRVAENGRYNYKLTFVGTIAENFTAPVEAARAWHDTMAYPETWDGTDLSAWGTIDYIFDETLRMARFQSTVSNPTNPAANQPRLPLLPVSPDLVYYGE